MSTAASSALTLAALIVSAQTLTASTRQLSLKWPEERVIGECSSGQVRIDFVADSKNVPTWILGVEADQASGKIAGSAAVQEPLEAITQGANAYTAIPGLLRTAGVCGFTVDLRQARGRVVLLHVSVPKGTILQTVRNEQIQLMSPTEPGLLISNDRILSTDGRGMMVRAHGIMAVTSNGGTAEVSRNNSGQLFVTPFGWRTHLTETTSLRFVSGATGRCCSTAPRIIHVSCLVDENGVLYVENIMNAPPDLTARISDELRGVTIKPFRFEDKPVTVRGIFTILVTAQGDLYLGY
ncbi:MAG TPA: hypothetical protein VFL57_07150 [Bryobacteraceae bacterium]|nr:hypothetical protein [Bryobacteraceae bacterium]